MARACVRSSTAHNQQWSGSAKAFADGIFQAAAIEPQPPPIWGDSLNAGDADNVTEVRRKNQRLRAVLKSLPWPKLLRFQAHGREYDLPLRASNGRSAASLEAATDSRLLFLAGFFDGDGSVSCVSGSSGCALQVAQSFDQAEILMLLRDTFGGSIVLHSHGVGLCKPALRWAVYGESARRAASLLAPHSITKQHQLLLAAQWPDTKSGRTGGRAVLRALKEYDSSVVGPCSWEYCAGFFDAEGYIRQQHAGESLALEISQKHPQVLKCLDKFFAKSTLGGTLTATHSAHSLQFSGLLRCKCILQQMLDAGLLCKAKQAELALSLTSENAAHVCTELLNLTGNQAFGKSLDLVGHERARRISALRSRARSVMKRDGLQKAEAMLRDLDKLKLEHELSKAVNENERLTEYERYIRQLHNTCWEGPQADAM